MSEKRRRVVAAAKAADEALSEETTNEETSEESAEAASDDDGEPASSPEAPKQDRRVGKKKRHFLCVALRGNDEGEDFNLITDEIQALDESRARSTFKEKHSLAPKEIFGPYFKVVGAVKPESISVTLPIAEAFKMNGIVYHGVYQGWKCYAPAMGDVTSIKGEKFEAGQLVKPNPYECVDKENKTPKPKFKPEEAIRATDLSEMVLQQ